MNKYKLIAGIVTLFLLISTLNAQRKVELNTQQNSSQTQNIKARDEIWLLPGFNSQPNAGYQFYARIDPSLVVEAEYTSYTSSNNSLETERYINPPDYSKPVGSIPGLLEVSPLGGAVYSIPIELLPGIHGMEPKLSLVYNSQAGNGTFGLGWTLSGLSVINRTGSTIHHDGVASGILFNDDYDRLELDGKRLIGINGTGLHATNYKTEAESYSIITKTGSGRTAYFTIKTKDGKTMTYGSTEDSRIGYVDGGYA